MYFNLIYVGDRGVESRLSVSESIVVGLFVVRIEQMDGKYGR